MFYSGKINILRDGAVCAARGSSEPIRIYDVTHVLKAALRESSAHRSERGSGSREGLDCQHTTRRMSVLKGDIDYFPASTKPRYTATVPSDISNKRLFTFASQVLPTKKCC